MGSSAAPHGALDHHDASNQRLTPLATPCRPLRGLIADAYSCELLGHCRLVPLGPGGGGADAAMTRLSSHQAERSNRFENAVSIWTLLPKV